MRIAWIGLGAMGSRLAARLRDAGHELTVWNRTREKADALALPVASSPADAASRADVVFTMLSDPDALSAVAEDLLPALPESAVLVEMSTVGPDAVESLGRRELLDAPVLGSLAEAEAGTLKLFVGGEDDVFDRVRPLLETLGEPLRVGPLGSGAAAKLVANAALLGTLTLLGETLALSDALGLDRERAFDVLALTPLAAQAERRRPALEAGAYPPRFRLSLAAKDAELIRAQSPQRLELIQAVARHFAAAEQSGLGEADYVAVLRSILG